MKTLGTIGLIGRFKPLHLGGALMLDMACQKADYVKIGVGSSNKYNMRNPFTAEETKAMLHAYLSPRYNNYDICFIPDFAHFPEYKDGKKWKQCVVEQFGTLDFFISGNVYVQDLLADTYEVMHPASLIPVEQQFMLKAAEVRVALAQGRPWQQLVPEEVATYLVSHHLDERFREEFGLETLATMLDQQFWTPETKQEEKLHTFER